MANTTTLGWDLAYVRVPTVAQRRMPGEIEKGAGANGQLDGGRCIALSRPNELAERLDAYRAGKAAA